MRLTRIGLLVLFNLLDRIRKISFVQRLLAGMSFGFNRLRLHEMMLNDPIKISSYYEGITRNINKGDRVLDLGTGTGILALFAATREPEVVYAVEQLDIIETARELAQCNGIGNLKFIQANSSELQLDHKVDVIIHEQLGNRLFDSDIVNTLLDCRDAHLVRGGKILPGRFEYYIEPVMLRDEFRQPFLWERKINGIDFSCLQGYADSYTPTEKMTNVRSEDIQSFLAKPEPIYSCDLHTMDKADLPSGLDSVRKVVRNGRLDGFLIYFKAFFDDEFGFSTWNQDRTTHWGLSLLRVEAVECEAGQEVGFSLSVGDWTDPETWTWENELH